MDFSVFWLQFWYTLSYQACNLEMMSPEELFSKTVTTIEFQIGGSEFRTIVAKLAFDMLAPIALA